MSAILTELEERFLRYVKIDTTSDEFSAEVPSTARQYDLLNLLVEELQQMGASDVKITDYATVFATIPATDPDPNIPAVAYFAHVDTSPAYSGANVKPIVHRNYDGSEITLPGNPEMVLNAKNSPYLMEKVGEDVVTSDGTTLLGADDKAGVAICMALGTYLLAHPEIPHGKVVLAFTPDEEIGRGVSNIKLEDIGVDVAYTLDGSQRGEVIYETFSADGAKVKIEGVSIHPGYSKGQMVNAMHLAAKFVDALPQETMSPETTEGREGFIHVYKISGDAATAEVHLIIRDFEREGLAQLGDIVKDKAARVQALEPRAKVIVEIKAQYRNMRYWLENDMRPVDLARQACENIGVKVTSSPIRGGTDGSRLTEMGLPTPNLFTGMQNFHGPLEWVSLHDMEKATELCIELTKLWHSS